MSYYNGQSYTFSWNGRRLTGASTSGKAMSFEYNSDGIRTGKTVNGVTTTYYLDGTRILAETRGTEALIYTYSGNGELIGFQYRNSSYESSNWDIFWYDKNAEGDILAIYDELGNLLVSYAYDAWGNFVETVGTVAAAQIASKNPFRYRSYYYDSDLNLYYLNSRYYDSTVKRFINADGFVSTGQGFVGNNMFAYCNNNPIKYVDYGGNRAAMNESGKNRVYINDGASLIEKNPEILVAIYVAGKADIHKSADDENKIEIDFYLEDFNTIDESARQYFYQALYDKSVEFAIANGINVDNLMTVDHIKWETEWHAFAGKLGITNANEINLDPDETRLSMILRGAGYFIKKFFQEVLYEFNK